MDINKTVPPTNTDDLESEVLRQSVDVTVQGPAGQTAQATTIPATITDLGGSKHEISSDLLESNIASLRPQSKLRSLEDEATQNEVIFATTADESPESPKPKPLPAKMTDPPSSEPDFQPVYPIPPQHMHMPPPVPAPPMPPPFEARVVHMGSSEFKQKLTYSAIEVLLEEPRVTMRSRQKSRSNPDLTLQSIMSSSQIQPITKPNPMKIRIRSSILLSLLEEVAKMSGHSFTARSMHIYTPTVSERISFVVLFRSGHGFDFARRFSYILSSYSHVLSGRSGPNSGN
jgi:hypothetical protein